MSENNIHPLTIGGVELKNNLVLGPMAGVCDLPFRLLCHEMGAGLVSMEMVSAKAVYYRNKNTEKLMATDEAERPVALQLFGSDPKCIGEVAARIEERAFDILDFNMGCPVPKVVNNGEGSALMKDPHLTGEILKTLVRAVKKPVTVKIRKGFDDEHVNAVEIAKIAEDAGVSAIAVHARTRMQYYSGKADWRVIAEVKKAVQIPVIGNGDLLTGEDVRKMYEMTGCDGYMIARGAQGNPWIFREILHYFATGETLPRPDIKEMTDMMLRQARMMIETKGEYTAMREMRKHAAWYTSGYHHSARFRERLSNIGSLAELTEAVEAMRSASG